MYEVNNNIKLRINPKYQVQTRPYTPSEYKRLKDSIDEIGQPRSAYNHR